MAKIGTKSESARVRPKRAQRKVTIGRNLPADRREDFFTLGRAFERDCRKFKSKLNVVPPVSKGILAIHQFVLGSQVTIHARGDDAKDAVRALGSLLEVGFDTEFKRAKTEVVVVNRLGMHARPSAFFVKVASGFKSQIIVERDGEKGDGKDIMDVHGLCCGVGATFTIHAVGNDADEALRALSELVSRGFDE